MAGVESNLTRFFQAMTGVQGEFLTKSSFEHSRKYGKNGCFHSMGFLVLLST